jgi:hypothetical protein
LRESGKGEYGQVKNSGARSYRSGPADGIASQHDIVHFSLTAGNQIDHFADVGKMVREISAAIFSTVNNCDFRRILINERN